MPANSSDRRCAPSRISAIPAAGNLGPVCALPAPGRELEAAFHVQDARLANAISAFGDGNCVFQLDSN